MDSAAMPVISCVFAPSLDTPAHIELAERLGYRRAWCYDSPAVYADPWMVLALAAGRTRVIGLGPASLVPSLRHPVVTAAALATLAGLAPGRVSAAFGTGLTGRMLLGERPLRWAEVEEYVAAVRALLRGAETSWNGSLVRLSQPPGFTAARPSDVAVLIAADGPRGRAVAAGLGDGVLTTRVPRDPAGHARRQVLLTFGTVLDDGEDAASPRAVVAAGPAVAAAYHAIYESKGAGAVDKLPGGREWRAAVEAVDVARRHLAVHDGHLVRLGQHDQALLDRAAPLLASWTMTGTAANIGTRLRALPPAGLTEVAYQPMGPDIARELAAFARAAGITAAADAVSSTAAADAVSGTEAGAVAPGRTGPAHDDPGAAGEAGSRSRRRRLPAPGGPRQRLVEAARYGLRGATQALTLTGAYRRAEPPCDAIDELAFDDEASAARCLADPAFGRAWASPLLDRATLACLVVEEHLAKPGPVPASFVKNYELVTKRPDLDRAEFDRYWASVHGPLAATIPTIRRYVQAHLSAGTREAGAAPCDGLAITWFDDVAAMRAGAATGAYARTRADEANFLVGELPFVITTERVVFPPA